MMKIIDPGILAEDLAVYQEGVKVVTTNVDLNQLAHGKIVEPQDRGRRNMEASMPEPVKAPQNKGPQE